MSEAMRCPILYANNDLASLERRLQFSRHKNDFAVIGLIALGHLDEVITVGA